MSNKLVKKFLSFSIGGYISLIIGFITTPIVTRMISPKEYGIASMATLFVNICVSLATLGLNQGFVRFFFEEKEKNRSQLLYKAIKIPIIFSIILNIIVIIFWKEVSRYIYIEENFKMIIVLVTMVIFSLINGFISQVIRMQQRGKVFSTLQVLNQLFNFIFILIFFNIYGNNYKTIYISSVIVMIILTLVPIIIEKNFLKFSKEKIKTTEKELLEFSIPIAITLSLSWIFQSADKIAIKTYSDMNELGLYSAAFKVIALLNIIQSGFSTFWIPVSFERFSQNPKETFFFEKVYECVSFGMLFLAVFILMGKDFIILLLGDKFKEASSIMPFLIFMPIMSVVSETTLIGINFTKKTNKHIKISIIAGITNIIGNMVLVPIIGARGAAISTGFSYIILFSVRTYYSIQLIEYHFKLKKFYIIVILLFAYSFYTTFFNNIKITVIIGIIISLIIILLYRRLIKEIFDFLKVYKNKKYNFLKGAKQDV